MDQARSNPAPQQHFHKTGLGEPGSTHQGSMVGGNQWSLTGRACLTSTWPCGLLFSAQNYFSSSRALFTKDRGLLWDSQTEPQQGWLDKLVPTQSYPPGSSLIHPQCQVPGHGLLKIHNKSSWSVSSFIPQRPKLGIMSLLRLQQIQNGILQFNIVHGISHWHHLKDHLHWPHKVRDQDMCPLSLWPCHSSSCFLIHKKASISSFAINSINLKCVGSPPGAATKSDGTGDNSHTKL